MKKFLAGTATLLIVLALTGCGGQKQATAPTPTATTPSASPTAQTTVSAASIAAEDAKRIALENVGLTEAEVTGLKVEKDTKDGKGIYEIEFTSGQVEYDFEIDETTGSVIKSQAEDIY